MSKHVTAANFNAYLAKVVEEIVTEDKPFLELFYDHYLKEWEFTVYPAGYDEPVTATAPTPSEAILAAQHRLAGSEPPPF